MGSRGASSGRGGTKTYVGYKLENQAGYANNGYSAIRKLPVGSEFTVRTASRHHFSGRYVTRYRIGGTEKHKNVSMVGTSIYGRRSGAVTISNNSSITRIRNVLGADATRITIHSSKGG